MIRIYILIVVLLCAVGVSASDPEEVHATNDTSLVHYKVESQVSFSDGKTPLWLNANKYGLSSLASTNGYLRASVVRSLQADSLRKWSLGYGLDIVGATHYTTHAFVQQAYVQLRWLQGVLTLGSKEYPMEMKNNRLSSGSQTLGINARPVPQLRLALPDYWNIPFTHGCLQLKGHVAWGMLTDANWQQSFTQGVQKHGKDILYHSKAAYLRLGSGKAAAPFSVELGLEMATLFGGNLCLGMEDGTLKYQQMGTGLKAFWNSFVPGGADPGEGQYENVEGNHLGSWLIRLNYNTDQWYCGLYGDHFFEDHSGMFLLDYNGYDGGENYLQKKDDRYYMYKLKDMMLGLEVRHKKGRWFRSLVLEYLYTKYQSGPFNHDHTANIPDHLAGIDDYYNHSLYPGWQHWGQVMGNPLYRSPIYNDDGSIYVKNNRFAAVHLGLEGAPATQWRYRMLATWQEGLGTYDEPYTKKHHTMSAMLEADYHIMPGWLLRGAYGMDFGHILGSNAGFQFTLCRSGVFQARKKGKKL